VSRLVREGLTGDMAPTLDPSGVTNSTWYSIFTSSFTRENSRATEVGSCGTGIAAVHCITTSKEIGQLLHPDVLLLLQMIQFIYPIRDYGIPNLIQNWVSQGVYISNA
jgi:hypothetical protein